MFPYPVPLIDPKLRKRIFRSSLELIPYGFATLTNYLFEEINRFGLHTDGLMMGVSEISSEGKPKRICLYNGAENSLVTDTMESWQHYWLRNYFFVDQTVKKTLQLEEGSGFVNSGIVRPQETDEANLELNEKFLKWTDFNDLMSFKLFFADKFQLSLTDYRASDSPTFSQTDCNRLQLHLIPVIDAIDHWIQDDPYWEDTLRRAISHQLALARRTSFQIIDGG